MKITGAKATKARGSVALEYIVVTLTVTAPLVAIMGQVAAHMAVQAAYSKHFLAMSIL